MAERHEIFARRRGRNVGVGLSLALLVALIFAVTLVKLRRGDSMEAFDHGFRASMLPVVEEE
jgi:hypothetical protein